MFTEEEFEKFKENYNMHIHFSDHRKEITSEYSLEFIFNNIKRFPRGLIHQEIDYDDYSNTCLICLRSYGARSHYYLEDIMNNHFIKEHPNLPLPYPERYAEMEEFKKERIEEAKRIEEKAFIRSEN